VLTIDFDLLGIKSGDRVLDIGCGEGRHSWEACKRTDCSVCAVDIEPASLEKAKYVFVALDRQKESNGRWHVVRGDAMNLSFRDASFDRIICSETLEHIRDDQRGIRELARVLKDDGILAVSVPSYLPEAIFWKLSKDYHNQPGGHVRKYKAKELAASLHQNNLTVFAVRRKHGLHSIYWLLRCIFGINNQKSLIPSLYHKFLVWDLKTRSTSVRLLDSFLNLFLSKSVVIYIRKRQEL
jgi:ubiquinone/menaquinone biosynthesis C-methylase UbiE